MIGFPKFVNTMQDVLNLKKDFPEETKSYLEDILAYKDQWLLVCELKDGEAGYTDATHKVVENKDPATGAATRYQFELKEDPNGALYRLGFSSSAEVLELISSIT